MQTEATASDKWSFSRMEIEEFREAFRLFDTEGIGYIRCTDFLAVLKSLEASSSKKHASTYPHLKKLIAILSQKGENETLDFSDYVNLMESTTIQSSLEAAQNDGTDNNFSHVFSLFDVDAKGYISEQDLARVAADLGENDITKEELAEMISRANSSKSGKVTLEDFTNIMRFNLFSKGEGPEDVQNIDIGKSSKRSSRRN